MITLLITLALALAGTEATTADGRVVILEDDGTWHLPPPPADPPPPEAPTSKPTISCEDVAPSRVDRMTGETLTQAMILVPGTGDKRVALMLQKSDTGSLVVGAVVEGASACIEEGNSMLLLFRDGTRASLPHDGKYNCAQMFLSFLSTSGDAALIDGLRTSDVEAVRVETYRGYVEVNLSEEQSAMLMAGVSCVLDSGE